LFAVAEESGDLGEGDLRVGEVALGQVASCLVFDFFEARALRVESPLQCAWVHVQGVCDLLAAAGVGAEQLFDGMADLGSAAAVLPGPVMGFEVAGGGVVQFAVVAADGQVEIARVDGEAGPVGVEGERCVEARPVGEV
jgi:hypothetical protein